MIPYDLLSACLSQAPLHIEGVAIMRRHGARGAVSSTAILFDASLTLWRWEHDPAFVLFEALHRAGMRVEEQAVRTCYDALRPIYAPRWRAFESHGRVATDAEIQDHFDRQNARVLELLTISDPDRRIMAAIQDAFTHWRPFLFPEVCAALAALHSRGIAMAIVSNGWRQAAEAERLGIAKYFDAIVGSVHVGYHKPEPEIFRLAIEKLRMAPGQALFVGDDYDDDVIGAKKAGMTPVLIQRDGGPEREDVRTIHSLQELLDLVG